MNKSKKILIILAGLLIGNLAMSSEDPSPLFMTSSTAYSLEQNQPLLLLATTSSLFYGCLNSSLEKHKGADGVGRCMVEPTISVTDATKSLTDALSNRKEKQARIAAVKGELVKAMAGEGEIHPVVANLIDLKIHENPNLTTQVAAAELYSMYTIEQRK